jgi:hypothetical protein
MPPFYHKDISINSILLRQSSHTGTQDTFSQKSENLLQKNVVFWATKIQFAPHRKHIPSPLQTPVVNTIKILGFYGGDYEEFRLLGCRNPVRTSLEIYYVSVTEPRR